MWVLVVLHSYNGQPFVCQQSLGQSISQKYHMRVAVISSKEVVTCSFKWESNLNPVDTLTRPLFLVVLFNRVT